MDCELSQRELVGFHFGEIEPEVRVELEAHLLGCAACLKDYLALKRDLETAAEAPAPSAASRLRLRRAVAGELGLLRAPPRAWAWWERPLAAAFAGVALVGAIYGVQLVASLPGSAPRMLEGVQSIQAGTPERGG
ncbi:MAG: anti-sigma factor family protein [Myxococcaceae bacterium]